MRFAVTLFVALASVGRAAGQSVTIDDLVTAALARAPELAAARAEADVARAQVTQATLRPNPMLKTDYVDMQGGPGYDAAVGLEWPLDLYRRPGRLGVTQQAVVVAEAGVRDRERTLAARIREQAGVLMAARRSIEVADEVLRAARQLRDQLDGRVSTGMAPRVEANMAAVEVWRLEADRALSVAEAEVAAIELKRICALAPDAPLTLADSLESLVRTPNGAVPSAPPEAARLERPDIAEAAARVRLAEARVDDSQRNGRTDVSLFGGFNRMRYSFPQLGLDHLGRHVPIDGIFHNLMVGATIQLPWRNRNQGAMAAAEAERRAAEAMLTSRELDARAELASALVRDREAQRSVELYAASIRDLARRNTEILRESKVLARSTLSDLLNEQRRFLDVEASYTTVLSRAYQARVAVRRAQGDLK